MENIISYLKKSMKMAGRSVWFLRKQYACFFAALFLIQIFFGLAAITHDTGERIRKTTIAENYDYHFVVRDACYEQLMYLKNAENAAFENDRFFTLVRMTERDDGVGTVRYDLYYRLKGSRPRAQFTVFQVKHLPVLESRAETGQALFLETSPLLTGASSGSGSYYLSFLLLIFLAALFLTLLYRIRVNHYRFTYGIYMSFGADFKKLFETSFWEMALIALVTFLPALLVSVLIGALLYARVGETVYLSFLSVPLLLIVSLLVSTFSVFLPMKLVSRATPAVNLSAADNSNLVSSPRVSKWILGKIFPGGYERLTLWRFRKYAARLILSATLFAALFITIFYAARLQSETLDTLDPEFILSFSSPDEPYDPETMRSELLAIEGVQSLGKTLSVEASSLRSFVLFESEDVAPFSGFMTSHDKTVTENGFRIMNNALYCACDDEMIDSLSYYQIEGDPETLLTQPHTVILSDSVGNTQKLSIRPGDTIRVAVYVMEQAPFSMENGGQNLLRNQLSHQWFRFEEFTVGAVIHSDPTGDNLPIYFSEDDYRTVITTGDALDLPYEFRTVTVFPDPSLSLSDVNRMEDELRQWALYYDGISVSRTQAFFGNRMEKASDLPVYFTVTSVLILLLTPLIWFFSQILFYRKRDLEYAALTTMGATRRPIRQLFLRGGLLYALMAGICYSIFSFGAVTLTGYLLNRMEVVFGSGILMRRYVLYAPLSAFFVGLLLTLLCAFLPSLLSYIRYCSGAGQAHEHLTEEV